MTFEQKSVEKPRKKKFLLKDRPKLCPHKKEQMRDAGITSAKGYEGQHMWYCSICKVYKYTSELKQ